MLDDEKTPKKHEPWIPVFIAFSVFGFALLLLLKPIFTIIQTAVDYTLKHGINEGLATLIGAIIGFGALARQAKIGFENLKLSQAHQAKLDRAAEKYQQQQIDEQAQKSVLRQKIALAAALYGELDSLHLELVRATAMCNEHLNMLQTNNFSENFIYKYDFIDIKQEFKIYNANISNLGLLEPKTISFLINVYENLSRPHYLVEELNDKDKNISLLKVHTTNNEKLLLLLEKLLKKLETIINTKVPPNMTAAPQAHDAAPQRVP